MISRGRALLPLGLAVLLLTTVDHLVFGPEGPYWSRTEPRSYAGRVALLRQLEAPRPSEPSRDVLVLGDSRVRVGLSPEEVSDPQGHVMHSAAVEGTRIRAWWYLLRALDPEADRYAAVVIPVLELNDRDIRYTGADIALVPERAKTDLRALLPTVRPWDAPKLLTGVDTRDGLVSTLQVLFLKGLAYRDDLVDYVEDPARREREVEFFLRTREASDERARGLGGTLRGLRFDREAGRVVWPRRTRVAPMARERIERSLLEGGVVDATGRRRRYLQRWLGAIVDHYEGSTTRVLLLPVPRAPLVRAEERDAPIAGLPREWADEGRLLLVDQVPVRELERPRYFADHIHLNFSGRSRYSEILKSELARLLGPPGRGD